ncbi:hypothetical protein E8E13_008051 [Curvularia kusanoi]|uniref:Uncharacterized protein n=1 Tax=Curvularia kusanoi TaxID=90978 RepID=A0A9P4TMV7_CURKU|nr:hypothetical protein E8E13_008051 [Curvularia kusanoi]
MRFTLTSIATALALSSATPLVSATPLSARQEALKPFEVTAASYNAPNGRPGSYPWITVRANITDPNSYTFTSGSTVGTVPAGIQGLNCLAQWYPNEYSEGRSYPCDRAEKGHWVMQTLAGDGGSFSGSDFKLRFIHVVEPGQLISSFRGRIEGEALLKAGINGTTTFRHAIVGTSDENIVGVFWRWSGEDDGWDESEESGLESLNEVRPVQSGPVRASDMEKNTPTDKPSEVASEDAVFSANAQAGVKRVEAATTVWTKWHLVGAYAIIWWIYFVTALLEGVVRALNPYEVSTFRLHSLTSATGIVSFIVGGLFKIPLANLLDTWGRPQGLLVSLFLWVVVYIMMAACNSVETYAAAQVFSSTSSQAVTYILTVFVADTSSLRNRAWMLSFATSPYIITTWIGGPVAQSTLHGPGWRWGFGIFAIVIPVVVVPLAAPVLFNDRKAKKMGLIEETKSNWTAAGIKKFCVDIDLIGILILTAGMALFLLPFSLWSYQGEKWESPMIICMIVFGGLLLIAFPIWEKFFAPVTFIPYELLMDRIVFSAGCMFVCVYFNNAVWNSYFSSMLQVVWNLNVTEASYVMQTFRVAQCGWCFFVLGPLIRYTGRFKWALAYFALPLDMLGVGLMIHFRQPGTSIGYIVMTQIFTAVAAGTIIIAGELAMTAPADHQHVAVLFAILNLFCSIGSAIGQTVSAAIWTATFRRNLVKYVPTGVNVYAIYASLPRQLSYKWGSPERMGITRAYGDSQRLMLITSVCMLSLALICTMFIRDINVKRCKQVMGRVA